MTGQPTGNLVTCDIDQCVALLTWNRPERRNAWTVPMEQEYFALLHQCTANPEVHDRVLRGGRSTSGQDYERPRVSWRAMTSCWIWLVPS